MKFIDKLNRRLGQRIRDDVVREMAGGSPVTARRVSQSAHVLAIVIVSTPYLLAMAGIIFLLMGFALWPRVIFGALLLAMAAYLRPMRRPIPQKVLAPDDAPALFALLDRLAQQMGAPRPDVVQVTDEYNAFADHDPPGPRILGIGAPLWLALDADERLAILAHEIAHFANDDPARGKLTGAALSTLARWSALFTPPSLIDHHARVDVVIDDRGLVAQLIGEVFTGAIDTLAYAYEKLLFAESQRAEYRADIMAAKVAGAAAMHAALHKIILAPAAYDAEARVHYSGKHHVALFQIMADAVRQPDPDVAQKYQKDAIEAFHTVDSTHPATRFRMEVVGLVPDGPERLCAENVAWAKIDAELSAYFAVAEDGALSRILVQ